MMVLWGGGGGAESTLCVPRGMSGVGCMYRGGFGDGGEGLYAPVLCILYSYSYQARVLSPVYVWG